MNNSIDKCRVFISKPEDDLLFLPHFSRANYLELISHSFLKFEDNPFEINLNDFDAFFFSSPRSVSFFLAKINIEHKKIAVAGKTTARMVETYGLFPDFVSVNSGNIQESVEKFTHWFYKHKINKILFPISNLSNNSYTKLLHSSRFQSVCVYKTNIETHKISPCDIYIFTSPSNVKGFFKENYFPQKCLVVSWGDSTTSILNDYLSEQQIITLERSSETACIDVLRKYLHL